MLKPERQILILEHLKNEGTARVTELAQRFDVDPVTIRRDLNELEDEGHLDRVHGGAVLRDTKTLISQATSLERRIGEAAARFIPDNSAVFLSPGPLTLEIVPFLQQCQSLTLITNALNAAWSIAQHTSHTLHVLGGQVTEDFGIYGDPNALRGIRVDWVLLQARGLDAERGLTHDDREFANMCRALFNFSAQVITLIHPQHLGQTGALFIAPASEVDILVTGREAANPPLWDLSELGVRIVLA